MSEIEARRTSERNIGGVMKALRQELFLLFHLDVSSIFLPHYDSIGAALNFKAFTTADNLP